MNDWARLFSKAENSGVYAVEEAADADFRTAAKQAGLAVFELNLAGVRQKEDFLRAASKALQFPAYFGSNWDAFEECITDLSWLEADGYALLIYDSGAFQECDPAEMETARTGFRGCGRILERSGHTLFRGTGRGLPFAHANAQSARTEILNINSPGIS